jgi:hypothetical protein
MRRVFISYARTPAEQEVAPWLAARLRASEGIGHVFLDEESFIPGSPLRATLAEEIGDADAVIFLISPSFVERDHPTQELHDTAAADPTGQIIKRIPVFRRPSSEIALPPAELARFGRPISWVDGVDDPYVALWNIYCGIVRKEPGPKTEHFNRGYALGERGGEAPDVTPVNPALDSLECGRDEEWQDVDGDSSDHDRIIVIGGARGEDHDHFVRRIARFLRREPRRSIVFVNWVTEMGALMRPRTRDDYFECLGRALMPSRHLDRQGLLAVLRQRLREGNLVLVHPKVDSLFDDDLLIAYYKEWLPRLLDDLKPPRCRVKVVQPIVWSATGRIRSFMRRLLTPRRAFFSPLDRLCAAEERLARQFVAEVSTADAHRLLPVEISHVGHLDVETFCKRKDLPNSQHDQIIQKIGRVSTSEKVFAAIDSVLGGFTI